MIDKVKKIKKIRKKLKAGYIFVPYTFLEMEEMKFSNDFDTKNLLSSRYSSAILSRYSSIRIDNSSL